MVCDCGNFKAGCDYDPSQCHACWAKAHAKKRQPKKLILKHNLSPGDVLVMTGAVESLHATYPGRFLTDVRTSCGAIWENNPHVTPLTEGREIEMKYDLINTSNQRPVHFLQGFCDHLGKELGLPLTCRVNRPSLYLSEDERSWMSQVQEIVGKPVKYWVVNAGYKNDFITKHWGTHQYQEVIDHFYGKIQFVQIGSPEHNHTPLRNVISLIGKTDTRQLIRLCFNAVGGLGGITFIHHIFAAFEKPYVCIAGGREARSWEDYPTCTFLDTIGKLPCSRDGGCWKSVVVKDELRKDSLCELPVLGGPEPLPKCMTLITPCEVIRAIERYYEGGVAQY